MHSPILRHQCEAEERRYRPRQTCIFAYTVQMSRSGPRDTEITPSLIRAVKLFAAAIGLTGRDESCRVMGAMFGADF